MGRDSSSDEATTELSKLQDRLRVLSDVTRRFAEATTDYERLLQSVAHSLAETIRDSCAVFLLDAEQRSLLLSAIHASDPEILRELREGFASRKLSITEQPAMAERLRRGEALLIPRLAGRENSPEQSRWQEKLGLHSTLVVPLRVQGRFLGILTLGRFRAESPAFDQHDLELAQNLADHAALAIENARLFAHAERAQHDAEQARADASQADALRNQSEERLRRTLDEMQEGYTIMDRELRYVYVNRAGAEQTHLTREQLLGRSPLELYPGFAGTRIHQALRRALDSGERQHVDEEFQHADGELGHFELNVTPVPEGLVVLSIDQTDRRRAEMRRDSLEQQLRQAQKLEAIGRLAGGVAHDFNNLLSIILGYGEDLLADLDQDSPLREDLQEIQTAANRAAQLTRQLLLFSRQQVVEPKVLDLNEVLTGMSRLLARALGEQLELVFLPAADLGHIRADRGSIEQVVMNLAVNARDAMPNGGRLTIETANVTVDEDFVRQHFGATPGRYVFLGVTDTGIGMDAETRRHIFEPFFSTKERGKGTGLGLSTVLGIVQQAGGGIWAYSEPGHGSTFKIYLPRVDAAVDTGTSEQPPVDSSGTETLLLVEDEQAVREVARRILERHGYQVLTAQSPSDALLLGETHPGTIHLLLTDVVMPRMTGTMLAQRLLAQRPGIKVLYMSGYTDGSIAAQGVLEEGAAFVQKPFTSELLARKVRSALDA
jgi:PAS domain S-box-containing protein